MRDKYIIKINGKRSLGIMIDKKNNIVQIGGNKKCENEMMDILNEIIDKITKIKHKKIAKNKICFILKLKSNKKKPINYYLMQYKLFSLCKAMNWVIYANIKCFERLIR